MYKLYNSYKLKAINILRSISAAIMPPGGREESRDGKWTKNWLCTSQHDWSGPQAAKRKARRLRQAFEEKASGAKGTVRPELEEAINYVRDGDVFVVTKLDRLARSVLELMQITQALQEKQCDL